MFITPCYKRLVCFRWLCLEHLQTCKSHIFLLMYTENFNVLDVLCNTNHNIYLLVYTFLCVLWVCCGNTDKGTVQNKPKHVVFHLYQCANNTWQTLNNRYKLTSFCGGVSMMSLNKPRLPRAQQPENTHWLRNATTLRYVANKLSAFAYSLIVF